MKIWTDSLENILLKNPKVGDAIIGTGGLRKIRIPIGSTGKRGGGRVIYVDIEVKEISQSPKGGIVMEIFNDMNIKITVLRCAYFARF